MIKDKTSASKIDRNKRPFPKIIVEKSLYDRYEDDFNRIFDVKTYLMYNLASKNFKIGRSKNCDVRLRQLSKECGNDIMMVATCVGDIEKTLHRLFSSKKDNGEWFKLNENNVKSIKDMFNAQNQRIKDLKTELKNIKWTSNNVNISN